MKRCVCHLAVVLLVWSGQSGASGEEKPRLDLHGDPLPQGASARLGSTRFLHEDWVRLLAFLPGDKHLLAACGRVTCVWDADSGRLVRRFPPDSIMCAALSPDKKIVAVAENGPRVFLFEVASGKEVRVLVGDRDRAGDLAWSADGRRLAVGMGRTIYLWDTATGELLRRLSAAGEYVAAVALAPGGKILAAGDRKSAQLWDLSTGEVLATLEGTLDGSVNSLVFTADGKTLVGVCSESTGPGSTRSSLRQWDAATGKKIRDLSGGTFAGVAQSPDGTLLAAASFQDIYLWDAVSGKEVRRWKAHVETIKSLAFTSDGTTLASGSWDRRVRLWDPATGKERGTIAGHAGPVKAVAFAPDGKVVASGGNSDCTIRFWDPATGRELRRCEGVGAGYGEHWGVLDLAYAPDGKTLISLEHQTRSGVFRLWDSATAKQLAQFSHDKPNTGVSFYSALAFAPDNETVVAANWNGSLALWEPTQGKLLRYVGKGKERLKAVALSPDGRRAAWVSEYHKAGVRDLVTGQDLLLKENKVYVSAGGIAFSPDGFTIAVADTQGPVRLWDAATGRLKAEWPKMTRIWQGSVAFSPDGRLLAAGNGEGIAVWEIGARQEACRFNHKREMPTAIAFAPHGRSIVTADRNGTLLVWDVTGLPAGRVPIHKLTEDELQRAWQDLTGADSAAAQRAIWTLAAAAPASLEFVKKQVQPVPREVGARIVRLIADLDAEAFAVREQALKELTGLGELAWPALRRARDADPSLEKQRRIDVILATLNEKTMTARWLLTERALAVVEHAGSREARQLLEEVAAGAPEARLTSAARAAMGRLTKTGNLK